MITDFSTVIVANEFNYKTIRDGQIKILTTSIDYYRKQANNLCDKKVNFTPIQLNRKEQKEWY